jgi:hypothetical protein
MITCFTIQISLGPGKFSFVVTSLEVLSFFSPDVPVKSTATSEAPEARSFEAAEDDIDCTGH